MPKKKKITPKTSYSYSPRTLECDYCGAWISPQQKVCDNCQVTNAQRAKRQFNLPTNLPKKSTLQTKNTKLK